MSDPSNIEKHWVSLLGDISFFFFNTLVEKTVVDGIPNNNLTLLLLLLPYNLQYIERIVLIIIIIITTGNICPLGFFVAAQP